MLVTDLIPEGAPSILRGSLGEPSEHTGIAIRSMPWKDALENAKVRVSLRLQLLQLFVCKDVQMTSPPAAWAATLGP